MGQQANRSNQPLTRRQALTAGLSVGLGTIVLGGCASTSPPPSTTGATRPSPWQGFPAKPTQRNGYQTVPPSHQPVANHPAHNPTAPTPNVVVPGINAIGRSGWTATGPVGSKVNPMQSVNKLTIHHEGWDAVYFTDQRTTGQRIEKIRRYHVESNKWGDIGYHYVVDRGGRLWEARPLQYQGAHVRNNNPNNIGILVLGNFEKQAPSSAQLRTLFATTQSLCRQHGIRANRVRSHREINPTTCPGRNLQNRMDALRAQVA